MKVYITKKRLRIRIFMHVRIYRRETFPQSHWQLTDWCIVSTKVRAYYYILPLHSDISVNMYISKFNPNM